MTWRSDRPGLTQLASNVRAETGTHAWSRDGAAVIYGDADFPGGPPRLVRRTPEGTNVVFSATDLQRLPNGCDLVAMPSASPFGPGWSPDGRRYATVGKMPPSECCWFLAIGPAAGGAPSLFRAPSSCYLNGQGDWVDGERILVELTGPSCGRTDREGRAVMVDARSGQALGEFPVGRKSALRLSPDHRWVASVSDGGTDVIPLDDPSNRVVLPLHGILVDWCCP